MNLLKQLQRVRQTTRRFRHDDRGAIVVATALMMIGLLTLTYAVLNLGMLAHKKRMLQSAVDGAAVAIAKHYQVIGAYGDERPIDEMAYTFVKVRLKGFETDFAVEASADRDTGQVNIRAVMGVNGLLVSEFLTPPSKVVAEASARVVGKVPVCVIALDEAADLALTLNKESRMTGNGCAIYSNSTSPDGLKSWDSAVITAGLICSAGGMSGKTENFNPQPLLDCPIYDDPLEGRPGPAIEECVDISELMEDQETEDAEKIKLQGITTAKEIEGMAEGRQPLVLTSGTHVLEPGTYCGGITIAGDTVVKFTEGTYVLKDGPLAVLQQATAIGEYTSFYFLGKGAVFRFEDETEISLGASSSGEMAGLLFQEDPGNPEGQRHEIYSTNARMLLGTIYLPVGEVLIGGASQVGQDAAYTAIIAKKVELDAGPHVVLNTDYAATDVPVPDGVYGKGSHIALTK